MKELHLTAIIRKENPIYVSWCPELNVASQGKTLDNALTNLREAVILYLEDEEAQIPEEVLKVPNVSPAYICFSVRTD